MQPALADLFRSLVADGCARRLIELARDEDLGRAGDVTTRSLIGPDHRAEAVVRARQAGVAAGLAAVDLVIDVFGADARFRAEARDGEAFAPGAALGRIDGALADLLALERTLLNLLGRLCGVAARTRAYVDAVAGTGAVVCDTRKTTPGLRALEKYAVRCGGGTLHRRGLHDAALYKDNHLAHVPPARWADAIEGAARAARASGDLAFVEVEVDALAQLDVVLAVPAGVVDIVLLDNMTESDLRAAVARRDASGRAILLEASGGITLETAASIARTGVDRLAIGDVTHGARWVDVGMDVGMDVEEGRE